MTEDEAKTKWCPFSREHGGVNRLGGPFPGTECLGSACMAWRKTGEKFRDAHTGRLHDRDMTGHGHWIQDGYCGLAGAPQ